MSFPYFINKAAPVSGVKSLMDYDVTFIGEIIAGNRYRQTIKVVVPVTSLCPCSKKISDRGAHNQRSHVTITATTNQLVWIEDIVRMAETQASCELYGLLKRPDEKLVTERAYDNPKFVEDLVRDVAGVLNADPRIDAYVVESENFESIHNHSAYALIENATRSATEHDTAPEQTGRPKHAGRPVVTCGGRSGLARKLLFDPRRLAGTIAQVIQLGAADVATTLDFDAGDQRRIGLEGTLDALAGRDLAHDEIRVEAAIALGNHHAFERLDALAITFDHIHIDDHGIAGSELGHRLAHAIDFFFSSC
jgi:hypothetical protein